MYLEVRQAVLKLKNPHLGVDKINKMLEIALEYGFCEVEADVEDDGPKFILDFENVKTSVFIEQWVKHWMRPFGVDYRLSFDNPANGPKIDTAWAPCC